MNKVATLSIVGLAIATAALVGFSQGVHRPLFSGPAFESNVEQMVKAGREGKQPALLLAAAQMRITLEKTLRQRGATKVASTTGTDKSLYDPKMLIEEAAKLAFETDNDRVVKMAARLAEDDVIGLGDKALADQIRRRYPVAMGAGGGPVVDAGFLPACEVVAYQIAFKGGEAAKVFVDGEAQADLVVTVLLITPEGEAKVASSSGDYLEWVPDETQMFKIVIENRGEGGTRYSFVTN
jgi:hypothetical protein